MTRASRTSTAASGPRRYLPPEPARIGWGDVVGLLAIVALAIAAFVVLPVVAP